jgi:uncharacterized membrane protein YraQ (UPF0718 family)
MSFQRKLIVISLIFLVVLLLLMGYVLYYLKKTSPWPPEISKCPDYWKQTGDGICQNTLNLGNGKCENTMDFSSSDWNGANGLKKKSEWAKNCGVIWDGISGDNYKQQMGTKLTSTEIDPLSTTFDFIDKKYNELTTTNDQV